MTCDEAGCDGKIAHLFAAKQILDSRVLLLLRYEAKIDANKGGQYQRHSKNGIVEYGEMILAFVTFHRE